ncbi:MFS transporter [uncultured Methanobrevibacter sp.]|uniref:MFS transporter n=1 Tax=uncultured Methanobrevibacter sp. TaxID=253161 RepID=UPI0025CBFE3E|nr:MFS transporter [uncultured Methanobrevibacter sp.]
MVDKYNDKIFTKEFLLIFGPVLFTALVMYILMSTVPEHATSMGSTATIAGLVSGIYIFGGLCSRVFTGAALERIGWRKIALIFMSIHFLSCLLYFIVDNVTLLIIVRFIHGIGFGGSANAIVTIASAILPKKRFSEAFGYFMLGTTIAVGLGPFIGGLLYDIAGSFVCFAAASISSLLALIFMILIDVNKYDKEDKTPKNKSYKGIERVIGFGAVPVSLFTAITSLGYVAILSFYRLYAAEVNLTHVFSWFFIIYSICLIVKRPLAGKIQENGGDKIVCISGIIAQTIGLF